MPAKGDDTPSCERVHQRDAFASAGPSHWQQDKAPLLKLLIPPRVGACASEIAMPAKVLLAGNTTMFPRCIR